jgi:hypothetical protein
MMVPTEYHDITARTITEHPPDRVSQLEPGSPDCVLLHAVFSKH